MIRPEHVKSAADEVLTAALLGEGWGETLQRLADAAEAGGASLVRAERGRALAHLSSTDWAEAEAENVAGRAPPTPLRFYPDHVYHGGFVVDSDVWSDDELRRDAYYQEFLRPRGLFFHAKLRLCSEAGPGGRVSLTLKRRIELGPYEPADIAVLDSFIPEWHMAFRIAARVLDAEASGAVRAVQHRGDPIFELDAWGRVHRVHATTDEGLGVRIRQGRLTTSDRLAQPRLERAISIAVDHPQRPALVALTDQTGGRCFLQLVPVPGRARDVFGATAVVAVLVEPSSTVSDAALSVSIREALGLTAREAEITALLVDGLSLAEIAARLRLQVGTARNHLKRVFEKCRTNRQSELVALLSRLRP